MEGESTGTTNNEKETISLEISDDLRKEMVADTQEAQKSREKVDELLKIVERMSSITLSFFHEGHFYKDMRVLGLESRPVDGGHKWYFVFESSDDFGRISISEEELANNERAYYAEAEGGKQADGRNDIDLGAEAE